MRIRNASPSPVALTIAADNDRHAAAQLFRQTGARGMTASAALTLAMHLVDLADHSRRGVTISRQTARRIAALLVSLADDVCSYEQEGGV